MSVPRKVWRLAIPLAAAAALGAATPAAADLRCGTELVSPGDSKVEVIKKCGEPLLRETVAVKKTPSADEIVDRWTYDQGPGRFLKILTFEAGELVTIEDGERQ